MKVLFKLAQLVNFDRSILNGNWVEGILSENYAFFNVLSEFSAIADKTRLREDLQG